MQALSKYVTLRPITRDTLLCREGAEGKSMYIMVRGYARAYNDIELTDQMKERRRSSLKNIFELERLEEELKAKVMERLELGGQGDVIFNEKAVAVFGRSADDDHKHRHQVNLYRAGQCFEESCSTLNMKRMSSVVALQGSVVGEITKSDLNPILLNTPGAHLVLQKHWTGVTPLSLIAEALAKQCPSALVPKLDEFELRWLSVGAKLDDWDQGHKLFTLGKPTYSIFMVMDGELSVFGKDDDGKMVEIAVLGEGKTVGEVGLIVGAKATTTVVCKTHCALIEIPAESAEGLILSRPDIVDYIHHVKVLCEDLNRPLELMNEHIEEVSELYKQEMAQESLEDNGTKADPPYFSSWFEGTTVEVVEISPPVYGNAPASRGRYERCDELLDEQSYKQTYRAFDTEWGMSVAWNTVRLSKLSPTIKMQFLTEVATTLILTNEQPSWLRYDLRAQHDGSFKFLTKWEMSKAKEVDEYKPGGLSPRSQPLGEARGHLGLSQTEFEAGVCVCLVCVCVCVCVCAIVNLGFSAGKLMMVQGCCVL
jgi:CRP-like cAMP-binding protein